MTEREANLLVTIGTNVVQGAIDAHKPGALKAIEEQTRYHPPMPEREPETPPAPRPTCGTCPHLSRTETGGGICTGGFPTLSNDFKFGQWPMVLDEYFCGQHPEMPAWIRDEWPKVKR